MFDVKKHAYISEYEIWANPTPNMTLEELCAKLKELGNTIIEVDEINNRVKVGYGKFSNPTEGVHHGIINR